MKRALAALALLVPLTTQAVVFGIVRTSGGQLELHDTPGPCVGGALAATYRPANPKSEPVQGCWVARDGFVYLVFLDGDVGKIPMAAVREPETT